MVLQERVSLATENACVMVWRRIPCAMGRSDCFFGLVAFRYGARGRRIAVTIVDTARMHRAARKVDSPHQQGQNSNGLCSAELHSAITTCVGTQDAGRSSRHVASRDIYVDLMRSQSHSQQPKIRVSELNERASEFFAESMQAMQKFLPDKMPVCTGMHFHLIAPFFGGQQVPAARDLKCSFV